MEQEDGFGFLIGSGLNWQPFTDWIRATHYTNSEVLPAKTNGSPHLFRVEAKP